MLSRLRPSLLSSHSSSKLRGLIKKSFSVNQSQSVEMPVSAESLYSIHDDRQENVSKILQSKTMQEMMHLYNSNDTLTNKLDNYAARCRRGLFTDNLFMKTLFKDYIKTSAKIGYHEKLIEITMRYMANYIEQKGEKGMKGKDVYGPELFDSTLFPHLKKDLQYMCMPAVEVDHACLLSILDSFKRVKYKDYDILNGLAMKLVLLIRNPDERILDQDYHNPFTASELLKFYAKDFKNHNLKTNKSKRTDLVEEFMMQKFKNTNFGEMDPKMKANLKSYLLSELSNSELMMNFNFDDPASFNLYNIFTQDHFVKHISTMMMLNETDMNTLKPLPKDIDLDVNPEIVEEELEYVDLLFENINAIIDNVAQKQLKITDSFKKLRENFFRLNNLQKENYLKENPSLFMDLLEFEESMVALGIVLPNELNLYINRKNYKYFKIDPKSHSKIVSSEEIFGEVTEQQLEETQHRNQILLKNFMSRVDIDQDFAEFCLTLSRKNAEKEEPQIDQFDHAKAELKVREKIDWMLRKAKHEKMIQLGKFLEFLELNMGDTVDSTKNYKMVDFQTMFGFEHNTRKLLEEFNNAREINETQIYHDIIDQDHSRIGRYYFHKIFGETKKMIEWALSPEIASEDRMLELMCSLSVFGKSICKSETNQISIKLALIGKIIRAYQNPTTQLTTNYKKEGILVDFGVYSNVIPNSKNVCVSKSDKKLLFVSKEFCERCVLDIELIDQDISSAFIEGFKNMPAELAGELLASPVTQQMVKSLKIYLLQNNVPLEEKIQKFGSMFALRTVLLDFRSKISLFGQENLDMTDLIDSNIKYFDTAEKNYPKVLAELVSHKHKDFKTKFDLAEKNVFNFANTEQGFLMKNEPVRRIALGVILSTIGDSTKSHYKATLSKRHIIPQLCPDTFVTFAGRTKAVYVSSAENFNADSVQNLVKTAYLKTVFGQLFDSSVDSKFVCLQDFMEDPDFYQTFNLKFQQNKSYLDALSQNIMLTKTQFFPFQDMKLLENKISPKESGQHIDMMIVKANLKSVFDREKQRLLLKTDMLNLFEYIDELLVSFNRSSFDFEKEQYLNLANQLYFLLKVIAEKLKPLVESQIFNESSLKEIQAAIREVGSFINLQNLEGLKHASDFSIHGRRIAMDSFQIGNSLQTDKQLEESKQDLISQGVEHPLLDSENSWKVELLNYKMFNSEEYFFFSDWKSHFESTLISNQYSLNSDKYIITDFALAPRCLTPSVTGRFQKKSSHVSINWDNLVYKSSDAQKVKALEMDELVYKNALRNESELSADDKFKLSLSNMLWDLKLSSDPAKELTKVLECDFWMKIAALDKQNKGLEQLGFDPESYDACLFDSQYKETLYSKKFEKLRTMKKEIAKWKEFIKIKIPDIYSKTEDFAMKKEILKFSEYAKRKYADMLKEYRRKFLKKNSFFANSEAKDFERSLNSDIYKEYKPEESNKALEDRLLRTEEEVRLFAQNNLLKMSLLIRKEKPLTQLSQDETKLIGFWDSQIEDKIYDDFIHLNNEIWEISIKDIFSEKDLKTFDEVFPHMSIRDFTDRSLSDLLSMLNLGVNPHFLDTYEKLQFAKNMETHDANINLKSILNLEGRSISNISRFTTNYIENYINLLSQKMEAVEKRDMKKLYGFKKENEHNLVWTEADLESFNDFIESLPLLQNPYDAIKLWIERKEKESRVRNSVGNVHIKSLAVSDAKLGPVMAKRRRVNEDKLSDSLFKKPYNEVNSKDLNSLIEHILERLYLLKKNTPMNFLELVYFILLHPKLNKIDRINFLESLHLFKIELKDLTIDHILAEYPIIFNESTHFSNDKLGLNIDDLMRLADALIIHQDKIYLK